MYKAIIFFALAVTAVHSLATEAVIRQTRPDGAIDRSKPAWQVDKAGIVTQLRPDGTPDRSKPRYKIQGDTMYELRRDGTVDRSKPLTLPRKE